MKLQVIAILLIGTGLLSGCSREDALKASCCWSHRRVYISAMCQDGHTDLRQFESTELSKDEMEVMAKRIEQELCAGPSGVFKLLPRKEYWQ